MTNIPTDLQLQKWQPLNDLLLQLQSRMSVFDGGKFILENWACKYIDIRLDMRVGATYARPGSGPDSIYTKLAQAEHERDCAVETLIAARELLRKCVTTGYSRHEINCFLAGPSPVDVSPNLGDSNAREATLAGNPADTSNVEQGDISGTGRDVPERGDQQQPASHAERMFRSHPKASDLANLIRSRLFQAFLGQGFWHAHHVDLIWRYNGQDVREEADWLKDVWYVMRGSSVTRSVTTNEEWK